MSFLGLHWSDLDPFNPTGKLGSLFSSDQPPAPPNYSALAQQDTSANRPNIFTPFGSQTWSQGPDGQWSMNVGLSPERQSLLNQQMGLQGSQLGLAQGMLPGMQQMLGQPLPDGSQARDQAINAAYGQATSRLNPQWDQRAEQERTQLYNQGFREGDQGYQREMDNFNRSRNDAYSSAMNGAIGQGTQAGQSIFNMGMASRELPFQEYAQLSGTPQVGMPQMPGFTPAASQLNAATLGYGAQLANWNAQQAGQQGAMNGLFSFGSAALPSLFGGGGGAAAGAAAGPAAFALPALIP